jgi:asparagine synthase (glutamine-hydrolysing)
VSGISGIYNLDGRPADPALLAKMAQAIAHRGPDGIGYWTNGPVGFSHLLLQTIPESAGERQPVKSDDGLRCLTMDGRIDNRKELRAELESRGFRLRDRTDAELVLHAYECWGEEFPLRLLGDFALAIWDERKKQLFCARDYVGVRPFYYYRNASFFAFGSEIRALLALDAIPRRLNESRLVDYLVEALDREDEESTFYEGVQRLPAGHSLVVAPDGFAIRDYWNLKAPPTLKLRSLEEYGEAFREVFVEAVRCRLHSSHRVGSTLSGGIDSSSVVCTTRELLRDELQEPMHTISLVDADESKCGETPYIQEVLRGGWVVPHVVRSNEVSNLEREMCEADEPFEFGRYFPNWFVFSVADVSGVRVLLDGVSGDHITAPYNYLSILIRSLKWKAVINDLSFNAKTYNEPILTSLLGSGLGPLLPNLSIGLRQRIRRRRTRSVVDNALVKDEFAERMKTSRRFAARSRATWIIAQDLGRLHSWSFTSGTLPFFFEHTGRMAAMKGVETRHPFSDRRFIEFALSLPLRMKTYGPMPKRVIRSGMNGILPELVRSRLQFAHPGGSFMTALVAGREKSLQPSEFKHLLAPLEGYVNVNQLEADRASWLSGNNSDGYSLWQILNLALWLKAKRLSN